MEIVFRADASFAIGSGHVMRCLTLADELRRRGGQSSFLCKKLQGNLISYIENRGYLVRQLNVDEDVISDQREDALQCVNALFKAGDIDWLVVDNYDLDAAWEFSLRSVVKKIFVIDDLANRPHCCDILMDQNLYADADSRYVGLLPEACRTLFGPEYALLRAQFNEVRKTLRTRDGRIWRMLVFFGGCDLGNETLKALRAIQCLNQSELSVDVVIGLQNPNRQVLETFSSSLEGVTLHFQVSNMATLIATADLYVGAAGTTTWERCCLGLPSLVITVAANQVQATRALDQLGVLTYLGESSAVNVEQLVRGINECIASPEHMRNQSAKGMALVDGFGASRCAEAILV